MRPLPFDLRLALEPTTLRLLPRWLNGRRGRCTFGAFVLQIRFSDKSYSYFELLVLLFSLS